MNNSRSTNVQLSLTQDVANYQHGMFSLFSLEIGDEAIAKLDTTMNWQPGNWDVICQRGKEYYEHVGNRRFRMCIQNNLENYIRVETKQEKSLIVSGIVESIQECSARSGGYGFVKKDLLTGRWVKVSQAHAKEKVGQALRDLVKARRAELKKISSEILFPALFEQSVSDAETSSINPAPFVINESRSLLRLDSPDALVAVGPLSSTVTTVGQTWTSAEVDPIPLEQSNNAHHVCKKDHFFEMMDQQDTKRRRVSTGFSSGNCPQSLLQVPSCELSNTDILSWPVNENLGAANSSVMDFGYDVFWPSPAEFESTKSKKRSFASRSA